MSEINLNQKTTSKSDEFENFRVQLGQIFLSYETHQDDALLNGFLSFVHSKVEKRVFGCLEAAQNETNKQHAELQRTADEVLDALWLSVHYAVFKKFQHWMLFMISASESNPKSGRSVQNRKLEAKMTKYYKSVHKFYYALLEKTLAEYDVTCIVPARFLKLLNVPSAQKEGRIILNVNDPRSIAITLVIHRCLLYIGSSSRYKTLCERGKGPYGAGSFKKALRYYDLALLLLPSVGETHLQKGLIYVQTKNYGFACYSFSRSASSRIFAPSGLLNLLNCIANPKSRTFQQILAQFRGLREVERNRKLQCHREIIETYFLVLFGAMFSPQTWLMGKSNRIIGDASVDDVKRILRERILLKYNQNMNIILQNCIMLITGFDLLKSKAMEHLRSPESESRYLCMAFDHLIFLLNNIVAKEWAQNNDGQYLALLRIVMAWVKCDKNVLKYAHRREDFCTSISKIMNQISTSSQVKLFEMEHRPQRNYYFDEDVSLREVKTFRHALTDFQDENIFKEPDAALRVAGLYDKKYSVEEENDLRRQAIVVSLKKFLSKNSSLSAKKNVVSGNHIAKPHSFVKKVVGVEQTRFEINNRPTVEHEELEVLQTTEFKSDPGFAGWGYSGSSVPAAPSGFKVRPSNSLVSGGKEQSAKILKSATSSESVGGLRQPQASTSAVIAAPHPNNMISPYMSHPNIASVNLPPVVYPPYWQQQYQPPMHDAFYRGMPSGLPLNMNTFPPVAPTPDSRHPAHPAMYPTIQGSSYVNNFAHTPY
ncbi:LAMI_0H19108g1_1 [Lachancea mirantina]|uniref:LAMI_0H19108g1_1 n=1 Tax=Lachancea mirantina TaxID=1230905 RepID=A0A1G4KJQ0_9SACH|nr:LAMI_0H19108g1_1 [Lachancea mirantina]